MFSLTENQKKLLLAFFIAVLLWTYASNQTSNIFSFGEEKAASFLVDIKIRNLPAEYKVDSISVDKAVVRLDYISYFSNVSKENIDAYINLENIETGDNMRIIEVELPSGTRLMSVDPGYVVVNISEKDESQD
jgi:YbbR domain-containing protein